MVVPAKKWSKIEDREEASTSFAANLLQVPIYLTSVIALLFVLLIILCL